MQAADTMTAAMKSTGEEDRTLRHSSIRQLACRKRFSLMEVLTIVVLSNMGLWGWQDVYQAMTATTKLSTDVSASTSFYVNTAGVTNAKSTMDGRFAAPTKPWKKIVVFTLFAADPINPLPPYLEKGVWENIRGYHFYFPDWICRFYVTKNMPAQFIEDLQQSQIPVEVILMDDWGTTFEETRLQRFLPFDDPEVSHVLSRDLDSRPSVRELLAVNEWLGSPQKFHTMRDHQQHAVAVMAGMFGYKAGVLGDRKMTDMLQVFRSNPDTHKNDQVFLERYIWPIVKTDTFQHDGHPDKPWSKRFCKQTQGGCHPFPMSNAYGGFFVGQPFKAGIGGNVEQYTCFSTCSVTTDLECSCQTKTCGGRDMIFGGTGIWGKGDDWNFQQEVSEESTNDPVCIRQ